MSEVNFDEITDGTIEGNGVFDAIMRSVKSHLKEEYQSSRIRGADYAAVYTQSIVNSMSQAIQWQLGAETAKNQALLIAAQIIGQEKQNLLIDQQILQLQEQVKLTKAQTDNTIAEGEILPFQKTLIENQVEMIKQQLLTEIQNTANIKFTVENMLPIQENLLGQKLITEKAQTQSITEQGVVEGILGKQMALYAKQTEGYDRDAEQKALKLIADVWGVGITADVTDIPFEANVNMIDEAIRAVRHGAKITDDYSRGTDGKIVEDDNQSYTIQTNAFNGKNSYPTDPND